ncbi:hypothetical protein CCMA1212_007120 [Trichoderma ghanense]|uniref:Uncharacterized protein n=1 Tax=Trichoderma ghanense TaxID=65468 RepID=A0ABY2GYC4_9HYPO
MRSSGHARDVDAREIHADVQVQDTHEYEQARGGRQRQLQGTDLPWIFAQGAAANSHRNIMTNREGNELPEKRTEAQPATGRTTHEVVSPPAIFLSELWS